MMRFVLPALLAVTLCGLPAAAKQDCITFSVVLANPLRATGPSKLVEALPLRGDAIHEVSYEPSAGQVLIAFTAVAAAELRRVAEQYHDARPPHFVRISRAGYAPIEWFIFVPNRVRRIHVSAPNEKIGGEMVRMLSHRCGAPDPDAPYPGIDWDEPLPGPPPS